MILVSVTCWCSQEAGGDSSSNDYCYRCCGGSGGGPGVTAAPAEAALYSCVLTDKCTCLLDGYKADNRPHFPLPRYNIYIVLLLRKQIGKQDAILTSFMVLDNTTH